jgi:hypothetical protein
MISLNPERYGYEVPNNLYWKYIFDGIKLENISYYEKLDCHEILSDSYFTRDHHLMVGKKFTDI